MRYRLRLRPGQRPELDWNLDRRLKLKPKRRLTLKLRLRLRPETEIVNKDDCRKHKIL